MPALTTTPDIPATLRRNIDHPKVPTPAGPAFQADRRFARFRLLVQGDHARFFRISAHVKRRFFSGCGVISVIRTPHRCPASVAITVESNQ